MLNLIKKAPIFLLICLLLSISIQANDVGDCKDYNEGELILNGRKAKLDPDQSKHIGFNLDKEVPVPGSTMKGYRAFDYYANNYIVDNHNGWFVLINKGNFGNINWVYEFIKNDGTKKYVPLSGNNMCHYYWTFYPTQANVVPLVYQ